MCQVVGRQTGRRGSKKGELSLQGLPHLSFLPSRKCVIVRFPSLSFPCSSFQRLVACLLFSKYTSFEYLGASIEWSNSLCSPLQVSPSRRGSGSRGELGNRQLSESQTSDVLSFGSFQDPEVLSEARPSSSRPVSRNSLHANPSEDSSLQPRLLALSLSPESIADTENPPIVPSHQAASSQMEATDKARTPLQHCKGKMSPLGLPAPKRMTSNGSLKSESQADDRIQQELLRFSSSGGT